MALMGKKKVIIQDLTPMLSSPILVTLRSLSKGIMKKQGRIVTVKS